MKTYIILALALITGLAEARSPLCDFEVEKLKTPCTVEESLAHGMIIDMMLGNRKGMKAVNSTGEAGLVFRFDEYDNGEIEKTTVEYLSDKDWDDEDSKIIIHYQIFMDDVRNTDTVFGTYKWTVTQTIDTDGFNSTETFANDLKKLEY